MYFDIKIFVSLTVFFISMVVFWVSLTMLLVLLVSAFMIAWNSRIYINICLMSQHFMYFTLRYFSERYNKTFSIFLVEIYLFLMVLFFFLYVFEILMFFASAYFAIRAFCLILGIWTLAKFVEFLKRSMVRGGRYFFIF